jgi:hypothetical protein
MTRGISFSTGKEEESEIVRKAFVYTVALS